MRKADKEGLKVKSGRTENIGTTVKSRLGAVPGASVSSTVSADSLLIGATVRF